jgi:hypothetical protein
MGGVRLVLGFVVLLDDGSIHYSRHVRIDERSLVAGGHTPFTSAERDLPDDPEGDPSLSDTDTGAQDTAPPPPTRHRELHINALPPRKPPSTSPHPRAPPKRPNREPLHPLLDADEDPSRYDDPQDLFDPSTASEDDVETSANHDPPPHSTIQDQPIAQSYPATMPTTMVAPPPPAPLALTYDPTP